MRTNKSKVKRAPKRAIYDQKDIYEILDRHYLCHIGFINDDYPVVIPTLYGRQGKSIYIHGATVSRLVNKLENGIDISVSVADATGFVIARSAFHHSMNYESVVIFGKGILVEESDKENALKIISDHIIPGRWEECRLPNDQELKATKVIKIDIDEASAKVRTGGPIDDTPDYDLNIWAGELPIIKKFDKPINDVKLKTEIDLPKSVERLLNSNNQ